MGRNVGGMGEDLLGVWSHQIGIIANRSLNKDAAGWDYILEWPVENSGSPHEVKIPLDNSPCPLKCVLQVKSIDSMRRGIPVKLSNWFHLVRNPLPAFFRVCPTYPTDVRLGLWTDQPRYLTA
jgi:hypothetical protein